MAHKEKYTRSGIGHIFNHYARLKDVPGINKELSKNNYNLAEIDQPMKQLDFLHKRLSEIRVQNRKDINVMIDWIVTVPKDVLIKDYKRFFRFTYDFLNNRYGKENVISSYVHMDEVTPHMHYAFIPVTEDKKKGGYKLCAKEVVTISDLRTFHDDLNDYIERNLGYMVSILNESTKEGNKSIKELKRKSASDILQEANKRAFEIISNAQQKSKYINTSLIPLQAEYEAKKAYIKACDISAKVSTILPEYVEIKEKGLFKKQEFVVIPKEKWVEKYISASEKFFLDVATKKFEKTILKFKNDFSEDNILKLNNKIKDLEYKLNNLKIENSILINKQKKQIDEINKIIDRLPSDISDLFSNEFNN